MRAVSKATAKRTPPPRPPPPAPVLNRLDVTLLAALLLITAALFAKMIGFESVSIDQNIYGATNPNLLHGLTWDGLAWAFSSNYNYWQPIAYVSHMVDFQLFGQNLAGHYAVNLLWHMANTAALYLLLRYATGSSWRSAAVAALFALHPLHVEPVAWLASRKDVLSAFFLFLTIAAYFVWLRQRSSKRYVLILLAFALALMTKPTLAVAPLLLLCLDWWPLARLTKADRRIPLVIEKIPLFLMAGISSLVTMQGYVSTQREAFTVYAAHAGTFIPGTVGAGILLQTIWRFMWPASLSVLYPFLELSRVPSLIAIAFFVGITVVFARLARRVPYLISGWLWTLFGLAPVLGVAFGDRFTYVPVIGLSWMLVWGFADVAERFQRPVRIAAYAAGAVFIAALAARSYVQLDVWHDTRTLVNHTIGLYPDMPQPKFWLANAMAISGKQEEAVALYEEGLRLYPEAIFGELEMARFLYRWGYAPQAIAHYRHVFELRQDGEVAKELAEALVATGRPDEALPFYEQVHKLHPEDTGIARIIDRMKSARAR
jgi:protein O-mannosyl-transferase